MEPKEFLKTIYLDDRACKSILIDGWNKQVSIQADVISRIRSASGQWDFYTKEDILDGLIVFEGVESIKFTPQGMIPNSFINLFKVEQLNNYKKYKFELSISSTDEMGISGEVYVEIIADKIHLLDPGRPGYEVRE